MTPRNTLIDTMKARGLQNPEWEADTIINRLTLAGHVILPAAEVERTAQRAWVLAKSGATADQIATAIRALKGEKP